MKHVKFEKLLGISLIALLVGFASITKVFAGLLDRRPVKLGTVHGKNTNEVADAGTRCKC